MIRAPSGTVKKRINVAAYTLNRKFLFQIPCSASISIEKNKKTSASARGSHLPYISPFCVERYVFPKVKQGDVFRPRLSLTLKKNFSDHSVIASCRQSWVLSGSGLMRGLAEREECRKFFENKSEIWKVCGGCSAVGMEVCAAGSDAVAGVRDAGSGAETFGGMEVAA